MKIDRSIRICSIAALLAVGGIGAFIVIRALYQAETPANPPPAPALNSPAPRFIPTRHVTIPGGAGSTRTVSPGGTGSTPSASPTLSPAVLAITGDPHHAVDYNHYRGALRALTRDLSSADVAALMQFLERKAADQSVMRPIAFNGIKNDVLDVLLLQEKLPDGIGRLLVQMYRDKSNDDMWRDYCVQFMTAYYEVKWPVTGGDAEKPSGRKAARDEKERKAIEAAYRDALKETGTTIAGTALLGLDSLSRHNAMIEPEEVARAAMYILANPAAGEPARITAFSIAAEHKRSDALPEARIIAQTGETVPLQMAAIALLGKLGTTEDQELLTSLTWQENPRIKRLATTALESLRKRKV